MTIAREKTAFVTGASGFLGALRDLIDGNDDIVISGQAKRARRGGHGASLIYFKRF